MAKAKKAVKTTIDNEHTLIKIMSHKRSKPPALECIISREQILEKNALNKQAEKLAFER